MHAEENEAAARQLGAPKSLKLAVGLLVLLLVAGAALKLRNHGLRTGEGIVPGAPWDPSPKYVSSFAVLEKYGRVEPVRIVDAGESPLSLLAFAPGVQPGSVDCERANRLGPANFCSYSDPYPPSVGSSLRGVLGMRPHYFYAEALLADYYRSTGNRAAEQQMWDSALRDAPCVIVGKAELIGGTPVRGLHCDLVIAEYTGPGAGAPDGATLNYRVVTDKDGCFRLPCDRAFLTLRVSGYSVGGTPSPKVNALLQHCDVRPQIGPDQRFVIGGKIGVMEPILLRPHIVVQTSAGKITSDQDHPVAIAGATCVLSWKNYPGAANYRMGLVLVSYAGKHMSSMSSANATGPEFTLSPSTRRTLDFRGFEPAFSSETYYQLVVTAVDAGGIDLASSDALYFRPIDGMLPIKTIADANRKLPPGCVALSITRNTHTTTIVTTKPLSLKLPVADKASYQQVQVAPLPPTPADTLAGRDRVQITIMY